MFEITAPEIGEIVGGRKKLKLIAKEVGTKNCSETIGRWEKRIPGVELIEPDPILEHIDTKTVPLAKTVLTM